MKYYSYNKWLVLIDGVDFSIHNRITKAVIANGKLSNVLTNIINVICSEYYLVINSETGLTCVDLRNKESYIVTNPPYYKNELHNIFMENGFIYIPAFDKIDVLTLPKLSYVVTYNNDVNDPKWGYINNDFGITKELSKLIKYDILNTGGCCVKLTDNIIRHIGTDNWYIFKYRDEINLFIIEPDHIVLLIYNLTNSKYLLLEYEDLDLSRTEYGDVYTYNGVNFVVDVNIKTAYLTK